MSTSHATHRDQIQKIEAQIKALKTKRNALECKRLNTVALIAKHTNLLSLEDKLLEKEFIAIAKRHITTQPSTPNSHEATLKKSSNAISA